MNKLLKWGLPGLLVCTFFNGSAQQLNPMTEAVLREYGEILADNPKDYYTLYERATQYLMLGDYTRALSDIDMALEYTPESDDVYKLAEYSLKSDILASQKNYEEALNAINAALAINPGSTPELYKAGNLYMASNNPKEALNVYQRLQRESPRSQEAFYGMAKANMLLGNTQEAQRLMQEIENLGKQSYLTYCRLGDLYSEMGDIGNATRNYTIAYNMEATSDRPIESLKYLSKKNPQAVMEALDQLAAGNTDSQLLISFIKAILSYDNGQYDQALTACRNLASNLGEDSPAVYRMIALSLLALNQLPEARESIAVAEKLNPNNAGVYLDKAEIYMSTDPAVAYEAARKSLSLSGDNKTALMVAAKAAILAGQYPEAQSYLNEIVLSNPGNAMALLLRGYLNSECLNDGKAGVADYMRAGNIQQSGNVTDLVFAALGKAKTNKALDADGMINEAIKKAGNNKDDLYLIAVYYAQTGNLEKAKDYADKAVLNGYRNSYNLQTNIEPLINLRPIHHLQGK